MPSLNAMKTAAFLGGGAALGGYLGYRHAQNDPKQDTEDRMASTASMAIGGTAAGLALKYVGLGRSLKAGAMLGGAGYKTARMAGRIMTANPLKRVMQAMGRKKFGWGSAPGILKGVMALTAVASIGAGAIAYGSNSQVESTEYGSPDGYGQTQYNTQSVKERMGMLGAAGDMVLGLHNMRHG